MAAEVQTFEMKGKNMKTSIICAVSILLASVVCYAENKSTAQAGNFVNLNFTVDGVERVVALYIPEGYDKTKKWPLIIYLHGGGQGGDNQGNAVNDWMNKQPIVRAIRKKSKRFPALVLIPRCPKGKV
jgi:predicted peptidase